MTSEQQQQSKKMHPINTALHQLYQSKWPKLSQSLNHFVRSDEFPIKPSNPLLMSHKEPEKYDASDIKVMILGQENNDWEGNFRNDFDHLIKTYTDFYEGEYYKHVGYFKNHYNLLVNLLKSKFEGKELGFFWSNVVKIGRAHDKGLPPDYVLEVLKNDFNVLGAELDIIKPDVVIFLSGPNYDPFIHQQIENLTIKPVAGFDVRELARLEIPNVRYAFRTYHPQKMHFLGNEKYSEIYAAMMKEIGL